MRTRALTPLLNVADVAASLAWYSHLGFEEMQRRERHGMLAWALAGNGQLRLMLNRQAPTGTGERIARPPPRGGIVLHLAVDDARAARATLAAAGLAPGPVERQPHGADVFSLRDPDGHELAVTSEPMQLA